jgi:tetratricopeptide (TPR) repeat protein
MAAPVLVAAQPPSSAGAERPADAQETAVDPAKARALELFEQSKELYRQGDFQGAAALLEEAHATFPAPVLVYNLARAYEGMGEQHKAADAYERYLAAEPNAPDRGGIEHRVRTLRRPTGAAAPPPKLEPPPEPRKASPVPWVIAATGVAAVGVGVGIGLLARSRHDDALLEQDALDAEALQVDAERLAFGANVSLIGGGVLAALGGAWGIFDISSGRSKELTPGKAAVRIGPTSVWLSVSF